MASNWSSTVKTDAQGRTLLRVVVEGQVNGHGNVIAYATIIRNLAEGSDFYVEVAPVLGRDRLQVLHGVWQRSHELAGTIGCDHQEGMHIDWNGEA
jgi:hypothetical protein